MTTFEEYEKRGLVELRVEPDEELYDDSYIDAKHSPSEHDEEGDDMSSVWLSWRENGRVRSERWTPVIGCECHKCTKAALWREIERDGVWDLLFAVRATKKMHTWEVHHVCGGFIGDSWKESQDDAKAQAVERLEELFQEQADELAGRATFAAG